MTDDKIDPPGHEAFTARDSRKPPATGPHGVSTTEDVVHHGEPHRAPQQRVLVLDQPTYDALEQAVEDLDGGAVRRVPGGGLDLSGMTVRARCDDRVTMPGGYGQRAPGQRHEGR